MEEVNHTLCLESLQLRMKTDEGHCPHHSVREYRIWWSEVRDSEESLVVWYVHFVCTNDFIKLKVNFCCFVF